MQTSTEIQNNIQEDYYLKRRVSNSFLSAFKRQLLGKPPLMAGKANLRFGRGFHTLLLEPEKFDRTEFTGKERIVIMDMVQSVRDSLDPKIFKGHREKEYFYNAHGLKCKAKLDIVIPALVGDFKTTDYQDATDFLRLAIDYDYPRQAAWYLDIPEVVKKKINHFTIWGVSKVKPYPVFVYELSRDHAQVEAGREEYKYLIEKFKESEQAKQYLIAA